MYANIKHLLPHLFVVLKASGQATYPKWLFVAMLILAYWERVGHPVYYALMADHKMAYEELGEALFSQLARTVAADSSKTKKERLDKAFKGIGAYRQVSRNFETNLGKGKVGASHKRYDAATERIAEKDKLVEYLRRLLQNLREGYIPTYVVDGHNVTKQKISAEAVPQELNVAGVLISPLSDCLNFAEEEIFATEIFNNNYHDELEEWVRNADADPILDV